MEQANVIIAPIITEKSMSEAGRGRFTFLVAKTADKRLIRKMVEDQFKVNVLSLETIVVKGKRARSGKRRVEVVKSPFKKAIVRLKEGQKIDLFDIQGESETKK